MDDALIERGTDVTTSKFKGCYRATAIYTLKKKKTNIGNLETCCSQFLWMEQILLHSKFFFFFREFQFIMSALDNNFLSLDQNTNRLLVQAEIELQISNSTIKDLTS